MKIPLDRLLSRKLIISVINWEAPRGCESMGKARAEFSSIFCEKRVVTDRGRVCPAGLCLALVVVLVRCLGIPGSALAADCFCAGKVGNINCDSLDEVTIGDVTLLIDHLFISGVDAPGLDEANIDGDSAGVIDLADVMLLIDILFITHAELPDCPEPKDYAVYFWDKSNEGLYFAYHPSTNGLDSFFIPGRGRMIVSADGKLGYRSTNQYVRVVSLDSLQDGDTVPVIANLSSGTVQAASPDGNFLIAYNGGLSILRTSDYAEILHDSTLSGQIFSVDSRRVYGRTVGTYHAFRLDLADPLNSVMVKDFAPYLVYQIVPSPDGSKWYLYQATYGHQRFAVYDVAADSIIFSEILWPGSGDLAITPDGKYVFYTNPGDMIWGAGDPYVHRYNASTNEAESPVSTVGLFDPPYEWGIPIGQVAVTPDGHWLAANGGDYPFIIRIDLATHNLTGHRKMNGNWIEGISCQLVR
ncbi:MAG: hypothetical protein AB1772_03380 [Candidatus Zixiibacteriota bacterium]